MPTLDSSVIIPSDVLFRDLEGEAVALSLQTGRYYSFDTVATSMWRALGEHLSIRDAAASLCDEFTVDRARLESDLLQLVNELESFGLLQVIDR